MEQILQNIISIVAPTLKVELLPTAVSDLLIRDTISDLKFVVEVLSNRANNDQINAYLDKLAEAVYEQGAPNIPILLCKVDEDKQAASIALVVEWRLNTPIINKSIQFVPLTAEYWPVIFDNIKSADSTIRMLETTNCMVVKHVAFTYGTEPLKGKAELVYFRPLRPGYVMNQPENETFQQEFERYLKGIREENYPKDDIDICIRDAVKEKYGDADTYSSLLIFSTELNKLRRKFQNGLRYDARVDFMPPADSFQEFEGVIFPGLNLDIFVDNKANRVGPELCFCNYGFFKDREQIYQLDNRLKSTVRRVKDVIV